MPQSSERRGYAAEDGIVTRLLSAHVSVTAGQRVAFFHPEAPIPVLRAVAAGAQVRVSHRRFSDVLSLRAALSSPEDSVVPVVHAHGGVRPPGDAAEDVVVIRLVPERLPFHLLLRDALLSLREGGRCVVVGGTREGIKAAARAMEECFGSVRVLAYGGGHRVLQSMHHAESDIARANALCDPYHDRESFHAVQLDAAAASLTVYTRPGVFSWEHVDEATELLLSHLSVPIGARVLDLGCGSGVLGAVASRTAAQVTLLDADSEAVRCAERTMRASGATAWEVLASDVTSAIPGREFDLIVSNPPFHTGKATDLALPVRFLEESARHLAVGGTVRLVANRTLPYERELERIFGNRQLVADGARFKILEAVRRAPR